MEKISSEGKRVQYLFECAIICLVKNPTRKIQWDKTMVKGKRLQNTFMSPPHKNNYIWDEESQIIFVLVAQKFLLASLCWKIRFIFIVFFKFAVLEKFLHIDFVTKTPLRNRQFSCICKIIILNKRAFSTSLIMLFL